MSKSNPPIERKSVLVQQSATVWQGPMPSPDDLDRYNHVAPGSAKMLFEQFIKQSNHRMEIESSVIRSNIKLEARGQIFAFVIILFIASTGIWLIKIGKDVGGYVTLITPSVIAASLFFSRKKSVSEEMKRKNGTDQK